MNLKIKVRVARKTIALSPAGLFFLFMLLVPGIRGAEASWLIDGKRYHASVHGKNSCLDCHEDVMEQDLHPNPGDVNKDLKDFFRIETCVSCHDDVVDDLNKGIHGTEKVENPKDYEYCIRCHDPHYELEPGKDATARPVPAKPNAQQSAVSHETRGLLPPPPERERPCYDCHYSEDGEGSQNRNKIERLCFYCHGQGGTPAQEMTAMKVSLINRTEYESVSHAETACTVCHPQAAAFGHKAQRPGNCRQCHLPHDEKVAHDGHLLVSCEACHLGGIQPVRDPESKLILWKIVEKPGESSRVHHMILMDDEAQCRRCHFKGNPIGAVSMILPAKGLLCMPCHAATFSLGDPITVTALIVFLAGLILASSVWLTGSLAAQDLRNPFHKALKLLWGGLRDIFSIKILYIVRAMILDVLLQRRLLKQSAPRWFIHSLIFLPFVFRFSWGFVALIGSLWKPEWNWVWAMIDKNNPATAFLFDLTGITVILGVVLAVIRGIKRRSRQVSGLPGQDYLALGLIIGIVVIGFILEGMRIAMTGLTEGARYAFAGYGISLLFSDSSGLNDIYGYMWYVHAVLTGGFVAYLPFSRMLHIIMAPLVLAMGAVSERDHT